MARGEGIITEIYGESPHAGGVAGWLECPPGLQPKPGQYLLAAGPDPAEVLAQPLFAASLPGRQILLAPPLPPGWGPGTRLQVRGPLGKGFSLPTSCRRLALAALDCPPALLFGLVAQALSQGAAVSLHASLPPEGLADDVEILPLEMLPGSLSWADAFCAALPLGQLTKIRRLAGLKVHQRFQISAQALLLTPMPCGGLGGCGVCAVPTSQGWKQACGAGPVFDLNHLELP
jgi:hypothetical protein